jgi:alkylhydroperoxidase family enzyme
LARRLGAREEWLRAVRAETLEEGAPPGPASLEGLEPGWAPALRLAERMTISGHAVDDALYDALRAHWDDGAIVELALVAGLFAYFNRFNDALRVPVTR